MTHANFSAYKMVAENVRFSEGNGGPKEKNWRSESQREGRGPYYNRCCSPAPCSPASSR